VAVQGNYAYLAGSEKLQVVDVSEPSRPRVVGSAALTGGVLALAVCGRYAYVGAEGSFRIIDVSDPKQPQVIGTREHHAVGIAVQAPYAYVTDGGSLRVLDISTPTRPTEVSRLKLVDNKLAGMSLAMATGIAVAGQHAYVCLDTKGFCVVDISNPKAPKKIGANEDVGAERVAVAGNYA
jgi:hypothetical protein